jgi:excisionase family DNA binding protein
MKNVSEVGGRRTISVQEAGRRLGVSKSSAYKAARAGQIPTLKIGKLLLVPEQAFESLFSPSVAKWPPTQACGPPPAA